MLMEGHNNHEQIIVHKSNIVSPREVQRLVSPWG